MADKTITLVANTAPVLTYQLTTFRSAANPYALVDITGYTFKLMVKPTLAAPDAQAFFDLAGAIVTAASGIFSFTLTTAHTAFMPGTYPGQIRWWNSTPGAAEPPDDAWSVDYIIQPAVRLVEP